jgi:alkylation response protein AidB-like acyl-CoA dehydrogenase
MFCLTRTREGERRQQGITFLLLPMRQPGLEIQPIITLGGRHHVNMVHLTEVQVPVANRIGKEGEGWTYAKGLLQHERVGIANISRTSLALAALKQRAAQLVCGSGSLLDDPSFRLRLAAVEVDLMALEFTELRSLAAIAAGTGVGPESSILKLKGTELQQRVQKLAMEAAGLQGAEWGMEWGVLDTPAAEAHETFENYLIGRASTIFGGASEVQRDVIWKNVVRLPQ